MKETLVGRTRWRKFAMVMVPATAAAAVMVMGMSNGAIASSFAVSGQRFQISADSMVVNGFAQYGDIKKESNGTPHPVAVAAAKTATVRGMCQSVVTDTHSPLGFITMTIRAGNGANPVEAENLFLAMDSMEGDAVFEGIDIGIDAGTMDKGAGPGAPGMFGQQATKATLLGVKQQAWATNAGTFKLTGMSLKVTLENKPCF
ncbi:cholesterol esterase [Longispora fulva]|uniref:Cholesterol esterase n=1 Tax=Longispora fulva TaxID=619741 RepID=A0A8J7GFN3_9ACTN|nr:DUF6230 family protein [Longispora fulva]MBG6139833.1 hypothetical protein [Longispora fulva]GIG57783.1 cholesterol esterase [Longispora fulva]